MSASAEAQWEWYFEQWLQHPTTGIATAAAVAESIREYGDRLFEQVFSDRLAFADYARLRDDLGTLRFEIEGSNPEFQALHWEALRDPDLPRPLAVDCVMVRKNTQPTPVMAAVNPSPTLNVLMVTARPFKHDVAYRVVSRPLMEAIENSQLPVKIDLLRPATFKALSNHLEEKGAGHYQMIHFDCHGALLPYTTCEKVMLGGNLTFKQRYGRNPLAPYPGVKAFLVLESDEEGEEDLVEATELAALLTGKRIPVCMLNACQSGKQLGAEAMAAQGEDYRETSLGSRLMAAGMQMVVAMGYSVTVTAAKVMMAAVYEQICNQKPLEDAVRLGRRELFNEKELGNTREPDRLKTISSII